MNLFKKKIDAPDIEQNTEVLDKKNLPIFRHIRENTLDSKYMNHIAFSDTQAQQIRKRIKEGKSVYHLLNNHMDDCDFNKLLKENSPFVTVPIFQWGFEHNVFFTYDETIAILNLENQHHISMKLVIKMLEHELEEDRSYIITYIVCALFNSYDMCWEYVGKKSAYYICYLGEFLKIHQNIEHSSVSSYDTRLLAIISFGLTNGFKFDEILNHMNEIDDKENINHLLYFKLATKIRDVDERCFTILDKSVIRLMGSRNYHTLSPIINTMENYPPSKYFSNSIYDEHDMTNYLSHIESDEMWENIEEILDVVFTRDSIYTNPEFFGQEYTRLSNKGKLFIHRNFTKHFSIDILHEIAELDYYRIDSIILGLDDDLDVTKYISIDNTFETMEMIRRNLRQIKVNKLSGIENSHETQT